MKNNIEAAKLALNNFLAKIQSPENKKEIHFYHDPTGLGGQISRRVLAFRVGMMTGARVCFPGETMYPYDMCFMELPAKYKLSGDDDMKFGVEWEGAKKFDFWSFWGDEALKNTVYSYFPNIDDFDLSGVKDLALFLDGIIASNFKLNEKYKSFIEGDIAKLGLPSDYIAVHFRRGDKSVETPYVPVELYRNAVVSVANKTKIKSVYLASDYAGAVEELNLGALGLKVFFDKSERRLNNANHKYLMKNPGERENETRSAIKNIEILKNGAAIVGQSNAHFATIAAATILKEINEAYYGELISGDILLKKTRWKIIYAAKNSVKNVVKKVFPKITLRYK
jgi:hypothetical protein